MFEIRRRRLTMSPTSEDYCQKPDAGVLGEVQPPLHIFKEIAKWNLPEVSKLIVSAKCSQCMRTSRTELTDFLLNISLGNKQETSNIVSFKFRVAMYILHESISKWMF